MSLDRIFTLVHKTRVDPKILLNEVTKTFGLDSLWVDQMFGTSSEWEVYNSMIDKKYSLDKRLVSIETAGKNLAWNRARFEWEEDSFI